MQQQRAVSAVSLYFTVLKQEGWLKPFVARRP